jgi:hypothetical protein
LIRKNRLAISTVLSSPNIQFKDDLRQDEYLNLLNRSVQDMTYIIVCQSDLSGTCPELEVLLAQEKQQCLQDILNTLRLNHETEVIDSVVNMIFNGSKSEEILAFEMLELILNDTEKVWVLPLLRETNSNAMLNKLEMEFSQVPMGEKDRLLSIIGKNRITLNELTRAAALKELLNHGYVDSTAMSIAGAKFSSEKMMRAIARGKEDVNYNSTLACIAQYAGEEYKSIPSSLILLLVKLDIENIELDIQDLQNILNQLFPGRSMMIDKLIKNHKPCFFEN